MIENATDQASIDRKRSRAKELEVARKTVVRTLMSQRLGRMYVWDELAQASVFSQTLQFGRDGHIATAFAEGRRSLGLRLLNEVQSLCPDEYLLMTKENAPVEFGNERSSSNPDE